MSTDHLAHVLKEFGHGIDLPDLALNEDGHVCIVDDVGVVTNVDHIGEPGLLHLVSTVSEIPATIRDDVLEQAMISNFDWDQSRGTTLCLSPDGRFLMLRSTVETAQLTPQRLKVVYDQVTTLTLLWSSRIESAAAAFGEDAPDALHGASSLAPQPGSFA